MGHKVLVVISVMLAVTPQATTLEYLRNGVTVQCIFYQLKAHDYYVLT